MSRLLSLLLLLLPLLLLTAARGALWWLWLRRCDATVRLENDGNANRRYSDQVGASRHMFYRLIRTVMKLMMVRMRMSVTVRMASKMIVEILAMLVV